MKTAGYTYLIEELKISAPNLGLELAQGNKSTDEIKPYGTSKIKLLAKTKKIGSTIYEHIETAIHYQGIRLAYLLPIFQKLDTKALSNFIQQRPKSITRRCIWYLYEWLMETELDLPSSNSNYAFLLDDRFYYTAEKGIKNPRTRIINNFIGNKEFCPMIRKTPNIKKWEKKDLMELAQAELNKFQDHLDTEVLGRSIQYLYTKETKSSTEIEKETVKTDKLRKFYRVLKTSGSVRLNKKRLIDVQNEIVRSEKKDAEYRGDEIYVGETRLTWHDGLEENIHYIGPMFGKVPSMMSGLLNMHNDILLDNTLPPMMHAAIISFGFVYIHPFSDGNGRIHRYLIHDVLKARRTFEKDFIIPVSAAILQRPTEYDQVLENISKPVMALINYDLNEDDHSISINNDISYLYRYPDLTPHVEFLYEMMETAISEDLIQEIMYIVKFDAVKKSIEEHYDIPNKELNLFIKLALQNNGKIGLSKRKRFRNWIDDKSLSALEKTISSLLDDINAKNE